MIRLEPARRRDRTEIVTPSTPCTCTVQIGGRVSQVAMPADDARAILGRVGLRPAPQVWRALGVEP